MSDKRIYELDGARFSTLEEFYEEVSRVLIPGADWGRNLDAFNDILRGGFGTPAGGFILRWKDSERSRTRLGHKETVRQLELRLKSCHPSNRKLVRHQIRDAKAGRGETIFDTLLDIISYHTQGGPESQDGVELELL